MLNIAESEIGAKLRLACYSVEYPAIDALEAPHYHCYHGGLHDKVSNLKGS